MKKLAALLASVAVLLGSHAAAGEFFQGEEAIELIVQAHEEGLILKQKEEYGGFTLRILLDRRYYFCTVKNYSQYCEDLTGISGEYEE